jgi:hypothetical protein
LTATQAAHDGFFRGLNGRKSRPIVAQARM